MSKTIVKEIGTLVPTFKDDKIVILFGPTAPKELRDFAVIHEVQECVENPLSVGGTIQFDDENYTIELVGSEANKNFMELGHISIYFGEPFGEVLPGAVYVAPYQFPTFDEGTVITFK
ncbi:MAG: PTS glucitol/sorbitol transporter subunit IIA [Bacillota bacterium]|nr:PTS glucitol/sorbitol transporter subunit IIA [Bacillota bacterium]